MPAQGGLFAEAPGPTGDERWDVLFAGLAEHLAMRDGKDAPGWSASRGLRRFWFPFDTPGARAQALVHAPAAFRRRGVFVADYEDRRRVSDPSPLLDRAGIEEAFRRLGDRLARRGVVADL